MSKPFVDNFRLSNGFLWPRFLPAPMEGIMGPLFVRTMMNLKLTDAWFTPFLRLTTGVPRPAIMKRKIEHFLYPEMPIVVQLLTAEKTILKEFCQRLFDLMDYREDTGGICGINFNFACPSGTVVKSGGGGAMLKNLDAMHELIEIVKENFPTWHCDAKIRMGFEDWHEAEEIIPALNKAGTDLLYVHFRTVKEQYRAVEGALERMKVAVELAEGTPVYGSGDLFGMEGVRLMEEAGCQGVVFGRGLLKDPFVLRRSESLYKTGKSSFPDGDEAKIAFLNAMLDTGRQNSELMSKPAIIEMCKWMFGSKHPVFQKISQTTHQSIFELYL